MTIYEGAPEEITICGIVLKRKTLNPVKYESTFVVGEHGFMVRAEICKETGLSKAWILFTDVGQKQLDHSEMVQFFRRSIDLTAAVKLALNDVPRAAHDLAMMAHTLAVVGAGDSDVEYIEQDGGGKHGDDEPGDGDDGTDDEDDCGPVNPNCSGDGRPGDDPF